MTRANIGREGTRSSNGRRTLRTPSRIRHNKAPEGGSMWCNGWCSYAAAVCSVFSFAARRDFLRAAVLG